MGNKILLAGFILQIVAFSFFIFMAWKFHVRLSQQSTMISGWAKYMYALYGASVAILVRNIVRIVEYPQGSDGFIASHEVMLYIFHAFLMFCVILVFLVVHPGSLVAARRSAKIGPSDSMTLIEQEDGVVSHGRTSKQS
jgi:hypothetical protein